jgi:hypothetical protein
LRGERWFARLRKEKNKNHPRQTVPTLVSGAIFAANSRALRRIIQV